MKIAVELPAILLSICSLIQICVVKNIIEGSNQGGSVSNIILQANLMQFYMLIKFKISVTWGLLHHEGNDHL